MPRHRDRTRGVERQGKREVVATPPEEGGPDQPRVHHQGVVTIPSRRRKPEPGVVKNHVAARDLLAFAAGGHLPRLGHGLPHRPELGLHDQGTVGVDVKTVRSFDLDLDLGQLRAGLHQQVVLEVAVGTTSAHVDAVVEPRHAH